MIRKLKCWLGLHDYAPYKSTSISFPAPWGDQSASTTTKENLTIRCKVCFREKRK